ncbi:MAG: hypothetical protein JWM44_2321 [Bacilli bacterium]|nr:hypothetical protein [Bacilli bacterium]
MNRLYKTIMVCVIIIVMLAGCSQVKHIPVKGNIKVMAFGEDSYRTEYGDLFQLKYPDIEVEQVDMSQISGENDNREAKFQEWLDREKPDVLRLRQDQYEMLAKQGALYDLDSLIVESKYSLKSIHPGILSLLKAKGAGQLYGLAPHYSSAALFYNTDLFDKYKIEYPKDNMSWREVFELAQRFTNKGGDDNNREYGISFLPWNANPVSLMNKVQGTEKIAYIDDQNMKVQINTEPSRQIANTVVQLFQKKVIKELKSNEATYEAWTKNDFLNGKAAMLYVDDFSFINDVNNYAKVNSFNWSMVTEPVNPASPDLSSSLNPVDIYAINSKSANIHAAWEFIQYINSDEMAKLKSKSSLQLLSRMGYQTELDGHSLDTYAKLNFDENYLSYSGKIPTSFHINFSNLLNDKLQEVMQSKKSVEEALQDAQMKGQVLLDEAIVRSKIVEEEKIK